MMRAVPDVDLNFVYCVEGGVQRTPLGAQSVDQCQDLGLGDDTPISRFDQIKCLRGSFRGCRVLRHLGANRISHIVLGFIALAWWNVRHKHIKT